MRFSLEAVQLENDKEIRKTMTMARRRKLLKSIVYSKCVFSQNERTEAHMQYVTYRVFVWNLSLAFVKENTKTLRL